MKNKKCSGCNKALPLVVFACEGGYCAACALALVTFVGRAA